MARFHVSIDASTGQTTTTPFTPDEEATQDAIDAAVSTKATREATITGDATRQAILAQLKTATAAQIRNYVAANVTNLATAQAFLGHILVLISLDVRN